jgi:hypothetical protein
MGTTWKKIRPFIAFIIILMMTSNAFSQQTIKWVAVNNGKNDYNVQTVVCDANGIYCGVSVAAFMKPVVEAKILKFTQDVKFDSEHKIQGTVSPLCKMGAFKEAIWVKNLPSPTKGGGGDEKLAFYATDGSLISEPALDPSYKYSIITGNIMGAIINNDYSNIKTEHTIQLTPDKEHLILWGYKDNMDSKKADKNHSIIVYVIDETCNIVRTEKIALEETFGSDAVINSIQCDVTPNNGLLVFTNFIEKTGKAHFKMANFKEQGVAPTVYEYNFAYDNPAYKWVFGENNNVYISGTICIGKLIPSVKKNTNRLLFFIEQDLSRAEAAKPVTYELNAAFYNGYPEFLKGKYLSKNLTYPYALLYMSDGIMYISENTERFTYKTSSSSSSFKEAYYKCYDFSIVKFDYTGKIQWIKMINKRIAVKEGSEMFIEPSHVQEGDVVYLFYNDNPLNAKRPIGKKMITGSFNTLGTIQAKITASGEISQQVLNDPLKSKTYGYPGGISKMNDKTYAITAMKYKPFTIPEYYVGTFNLMD